MSKLHIYRFGLAFTAVSGVLLYFQWPLAWIVGLPGLILILWGYDH